MSRSNPTAENPHPCQLWLEWKGGPGHLSYWDKSKGENGERVSIEVDKKPFRFIALDSTRCVRGYSKPHKTGVYSNEVRDTNTDTLTVKFFSTKEIVASGLWADIKDVVTSKRVNGGYAVNLYIAYKDGDDLKIGALVISGCALGPWFEFEKKNRKAMLEKGIVISRGPKNDEGDIEFYPPTFSLCDIKPESDEAAKRLDVELQSFLKEHLSKTPRQEPEQPAATGTPQPTPFPRSEPDPEPEPEPAPAAQPEPDDIPF